MLNSVREKYIGIANHASRYECAAQTLQLSNVILSLHELAQDETLYHRLIVDDTNPLRRGSWILYSGRSSLPLLGSTIRGRMAKDSGCSSLLRAI